MAVPSSGWWSAHDVEAWTVKLCTTSWPAAGLGLPTAQAGMPTYGEKRRVPGLRREEVASLAGVSFDYYARLERGNLSGSRIRFGGTGSGFAVGRQHLFDLAQAASVPASRARPAKPPVTRVRPAVLSI